MKKWIIPALTLLLSVNTIGQEHNLLDTLQIKSVSVFGSIHPDISGVRKIDSLVLQKNYHGDLANLLAAHSSAFIKASAPGSLATVSLRGTLASHTRVTWNGMQLNSPMLGQIDFSLIPAFITDQVSLLSGPASLSGGAGGLGGQVVLQSQLNWAEKRFARASVLAGSFHTYHFRADVGGSGERWTYRFRLYHEQSKNDFEFLNTANGLFNETKQQNADYNKQGVLAQAAYRPGSNHLFSIHAWIQNSHRNLPPIMSYDGDGRNEFQDDKQFRVAGKWQWNEGGFSLRTQLGFSADQLNYYLGNETGMGTFVNYDSHSQSGSLHNQILASYQANQVHGLQMKIHATYHQVAIEELVLETGYEAKRLEYGLSVQANQRWTSLLHSYILVTQDWIDHQRARLLPTLGVNYRLIPDKIDLSFSLSRNYHTPSLNDLYWIPGGNPDLIPEEGYQGDLGVKVNMQPNQTTAAQIQASLFANLIENWILWRPGEFRFWTPENLETVFARGFELDIKGEKKIRKSTTKIISNYAFTRTNQIEPATQSQLIYIPVHQTNLLIQFELSHWQAFWQTRFTSERFTSTVEEISFHQLPAFTLHHVGIGRTIEIRKSELEIRCQINNLLNTDYQAILWRAMPKRHFTLSLSLDL